MCSSIVCVKSMLFVLIAAISCSKPGHTLLFVSLSIQDYSLAFLFYVVFDGIQVTVQQAQVVRIPYKFNLTTILDYQKVVYETTFITIIIN